MHIERGNSSPYAMCWLPFLLKSHLPLEFPVGFPASLYNMARRLTRNVPNRKEHFSQFELELQFLIFAVTSLRTRVTTSRKRKQLINHRSENRGKARQPQRRRWIRQIRSLGEKRTTAVTPYSPPAVSRATQKDVTFTTGIFTLPARPFSLL